MNANELRHYGVLGMKWGVRRTPDQLARAAKTSKSSYSKDALDVERIKAKKIRSMTNEELRIANKRLNLEQQYKTLNPSRIRRGLSFVKGTTGLLGTAVGAYNNTNTLYKLGASALSANINKKSKSLMGKYGVKG